MGKLLKGIVLTLVVLIVIVGVLWLGSRWLFGPIGPMPGPRLSGTLVEEPVQDWSFVDAVKVIEVETRPDAPYSVSTWMTRVDDGLYVFAGDDESPWVQYILQEPVVRVRIEGRIHELLAVGVSDLQIKRIFLEAMKAKYEGDLGYDQELYQRGRETGEFILFRMEPR